MGLELYFVGLRYKDRKSTSEFEVHPNSEASIRNAAAIKGNAILHLPEVEQLARENFQSRFGQAANPQIADFEVIFPDSTNALNFLSQASKLPFIEYATYSAFMG